MKKTNKLPLHNHHQYSSGLFNGLYDIINLHQTRRCWRVNFRTRALQVSLTISIYHWSNKWKQRYSIVSLELLIAGWYRCLHSWNPCDMSEPMPRLCNLQTGVAVQQLFYSMLLHRGQEFVNLVSGVWTWVGALMSSTVLCQIDL